MEQHAIPRNITGFQFRLIGDMTLKQFGYLASGAVIGYVVFKILPFPFIFNVCIGGLIFFIGFAMAFMPFQDRPIDQWLLAFAKTVFAPTQFIYRKENVLPAILSSDTNHTPKISQHHEIQFHNSKKMLDTYLSKIPQKSTDTFDQNEKLYVTHIASLFKEPSSVKASMATTAAAINQQKPIINNPPIFTPIRQTVQNPQPSYIHKQDIRPAVQVPSPQNTPQPIPNISQLTEDFNKLKEQFKNQPEQDKNAFASKLSQIEEQLSKILSLHKPATQPVNNIAAINKSFSPVSSPTPTNQTTTTNIPDVPNLISGMVYDPKNLTLGNILVTIKDSTGVPLRALKTNGLGQFSASTPLVNNNYSIEAEDPMKRYVFEPVKLVLNGSIVQPVKISGKRPADLVKDKLTKELFGNKLN